MLANNWNVIWAVKKTKSGFQIDTDIALNADLIVIQREFPSERTLSALRKIVHMNIPIVYESDDMLFNLSPAYPYYKYFSKRVPYIKWILKEADLITVSTAYLKKSMENYTTRPIHVQRNLIDWDLFNTQPKICDTQFNFLISGTPTHLGDWKIIEEPLLQFLDTHKKDVGVILFGERPQRFIHHSSVKLINYQPNYYQYAARLKELDIHATLTPLEDTEFNRGKSNIKWLEYSAMGAIGAYSDVLPYNSSIKNGKTGLLVANTAESWFNAMETLLNSQEANLTMINNARDEIRQNYSIEQSSAEYAAVISDLFGEKHKRNIISELNILPAYLSSQAKTTLSSFWDRHIMWRFNSK
jgi:glycosyltransferase involved in cell wall biosynthesis